MIRLTQVGTLGVESLTYRDFYEGAQTHSNPAESDEPVLTG
jgi:hypothetical protein